MKKFSVFIVIMSFLIPINSDSFVFGSSNFDLYHEYPKHSCGFPPHPPINAKVFGKNIYLQELRSYDYEMERYSNCMNNYVESARNDIKRINEIIGEAISERNAAVREYNDFVNR